MTTFFYKTTYTEFKYLTRYQQNNIIKYFFQNNKKKNIGIGIQSLPVLLYCVELESSGTPP